MRHDVRETERLTLTVPPQVSEITIDVRFVRVRGRKATVMVDCRNWLVQSQVVHAKRDRGRPKPQKMVDYDGRLDLD